MSGTRRCSSRTGRASPKRDEGSIVTIVTIGRRMAKSEMNKMP
jgi:hypothetical protein